MNWNGYVTDIVKQRNEQDMLHVSDMDLLTASISFLLIPLFVVLLLAVFF